MRTPCVAGNWKMHKTVAEAEALMEALIPGLEDIPQVENVICPPYTALAPLAKMTGGTEIKLGAQNLYWETSGAFTGEISPRMVSEVADCVIIGHSERRAYFHETDQSVNRRVNAARDVDLIPILCVGETLEENEAGQTAEVVTRQLEKGLDQVAFSAPDELIVAYEPVWAIGTGKAATPDGANRVIKEVVRGTLASLYSSDFAEGVRILYGGSVKPGNAEAFFEQSDIDGALVGGASLTAEDFIAITRAALP